MQRREGGREGDGSGRAEPALGGPGMARPACLRCVPAGLSLTVACVSCAQQTAWYPMCAQASAHPQDEQVG